MSNQKPPLGSQPVIRVPGLVGDWVMNDGGGPLSTIWDYSGNVNTGTLVADTHFVPGRTGLGLDFDGTGDYISFPTPSVTVTPFTVSCWYFFRGTAAKRMIGLYESGATRVIGMTIPAGSTPTVDAQHFDGSASTAKSIRTLVLSRWYHLCAVFNSNSKRSIYINGVLEATNTGARSDIAVDKFTIGRNEFAAPGQYVTGIIESAKLYNQALTEAEVQQDYLDSFWHFRHDPIELWAAAAMAGAAPAGLSIPVAMHHYTKNIGAVA